MAGQPLDDVVPPIESQRATVIPTDPIALLGKPVPSVHLAEDSQFAGCRYYDRR